MIHRSQCRADVPRIRAGAAALLAASLVAIAACHTSAPRATAPAPAPPAVSYDWHGLLIAPFGSVLKDIPLKLHEVLLFKDDTHGAAPADNVAADAECYAADALAPTFLGRAPEEYLLCFRQDRLSRIQASVQLPVAQAPDVFAAACAQWTQSPAAAPADAVCEGRDDAIHFSFRLEEESMLSISLYSTPDAPAVRP
jgi:hypothetical protein